MNMVLESERLILRRMTGEDAPAVAEIMRSQGVQRVWEHYFSDGDVEQWIERRLKGYQKNGMDYLLASEKESGRIVGQLGLLLEEISGKNIWCLGWILHDAYQGRGYATEGARELAAYGFCRMELKEIQCDIRPENKASIAVAKRLGMTKCGSFVKHYRGMDMVHDIFKLEAGRVR